MTAAEPKVSANDDQVFLAALNHLWTSFETRRSQRLQLINYFLITVAFLSTGYVTSLVNDLTFVAAAVCVIGMVIGGGFLYADRAYKSLMDAINEPLVELESRLAERLNVSSFRLTEECLRRPRKINAPSRLASIMYCVAVVTFVLACVYAVTE